MKVTLEIIGIILIVIFFKYIFAQINKNINSKPLRNCMYILIKFHNFLTGKQCSKFYVPICKIYDVMHRYYGFQKMYITCTVFIDFHRIDIKTNTLDKQYYPTYSAIRIS